MFSSPAAKKIPKAAVPLIAGFVSLLVATFTTWYAPPAPSIHDEFAYLLAADTFNEGRLANPTHPHWEHFESFHILQQPTNASKYQPAQSLFLAIGQRLGHPAIGVCLSTAFAVFAVVWMLSVCLPNRWLVISAFVLALHPGMQFLWGQSYWGGAAAFAGAALVFGAVFRLIRKATFAQGFVLSIGITILAFSRPLEGMAAILVAFAILFFHWTRFPLFARNFPLFARNGEHDIQKRRAVGLRIGMPLLIVGSLAVGLMAANNRAITESAKKLPYQIYESNYASVPLFIWENSQSTAEYRHREMERFYQWDREQCDKIKESAASLLANKLLKLDETRSFFVGWLAVFLIALPWVMRRRELLVSALGLPLVLIAASLTPWGFPHYYAPAGPLVILLVIFGIRYLRAVVRKIPFAKGALVPVILCICLFSFVNSAATHFRNVGHGWQWSRAKLLKQLSVQPEKDLVFVRYNEDHNCHQEWVYNSADVDSSQVVWAREISDAADKRLISYFSNRKIWLLFADEKIPMLVPYPIDTSIGDGELLSLDSE